MCRRDLSRSESLSCRFFFRGEWEWDGRDDVVVVVVDDIGDCCCCGCGWGWDEGDVGLASSIGGGTQGVTTIFGPRMS